MEQVESLSYFRLETHSKLFLEVDAVLVNRLIKQIKAGVLFAVRNRTKNIDIDELTKKTIIKNADRQ